jgi:hypothetical protein
MPYRIAAVTMVYNEDVFLRLWQLHYGEAFGYDCLFVVDHGSDLPPDLDPRVNRIRVPRTILDEREKAGFLSDLTKSLLHYFDAVVVSDVDEFIVVDPQLDKTLPEYIEQSRHGVIHPVGMNVIHHRTTEGELVQSGFLFEQRQYVQFDPLYCKPSIIKEPILYSVGLHRSNRLGHFTDDVLLFHLRAIDYEISRARYAKYETVKWPDSDKHLSLALWRGFEAYSALIFRMNAPDGVPLTDRFDFKLEIAMMNALELEKSDHFMHPHSHSHEPLAEMPPETRVCDLVPERFKRTIYLG